MCVWSLAEDDLARAVKRWEKEHRHTQAACWLVFTKRYRLAVELLMRKEVASIIPNIYSLWPTELTCR